MSRAEVRRTASREAPSSGPVAAAAATLFAFAACAAPRAPDGPEPTTTLVLVRHAEKTADPGPDPALSDAGRARADELARVLRDLPLDAVFATQFSRTQATVAPAAEQAGLRTRTIRAEEPEALVEAALAAGGTVLVAGHSNTLGPIIEALGGAAIAPIDHDEYDRLYLVTAARGRPARVRLLRFGARSP